MCEPAVPDHSSGELKEVVSTVDLFKPRFKQSLTRPALEAISGSVNECRDLGAFFFLVRRRNRDVGWRRVNPAGGVSLA